MIGIGAVTGVLVGSAPALPRTVLVAGIGMVVAAMSLVIAFARFEYFLVCVILVRASLDALNLNGGAFSGQMTPSTALGAVFVLLSCGWLWVQRDRGHWVRPSAVTKALFLLALACGLSVPSSLEPVSSALATLKVLAGVLMFAVLEQVHHRRPDFAKVVVAAVLGSAALPLLVGLRQVATGATEIRRVQDAALTGAVPLASVQGTFTHPNPFGTYLAILLALGVALCATRAATRRDTRATSLAVASLVLISGFVLIHTYARMAWVSAAVAVLYVTLRLNRRFLWLVVAASAAVLVLVPSVLTRFSDLTTASATPGVPANSAAWRLLYWQQLLPLAKTNPLTGVGLETISQGGDLLPQDGIIHNAGLPPHNVFIQVLVETGLVGTIALAVVLVCFYRELRRRRRSARTPLEKTYAVAAVAIAIGLGLQFFTENLVTQTFVYWCAAAAMTFGVQVAGRDAEPAR